MSNSANYEALVAKGNNGTLTMDEALGSRWDDEQTALLLSFFNDEGDNKYIYTDVNVVAGAFDVDPTSLADGARYKVATAGAVGGVWYALDSLLEVKSGLFEPLGNNIYDPTGNVVVNMELADMTGIVPAEGTLGEVGNIPVIGDGVTTGGKAVVMRAAALSTATGTDSLAIGLNSDASGDNSTASGAYSIASGTYSIASGSGSVASGESSVASGANSTASSFSSVASGAYSTASGDSSVASGGGSVASGSASVASGSGSVASGANSVASGSFTKTTVNNTQEIGHWSGATTRATSLRTQGDGQVAYTIKDTATAPTDGGATAGSEADGTLGREMMTIQRNGDAMTLYVNDAGTIKSLSLGSIS